MVRATRVPLGGAWAGSGRLFGVELADPPRRAPYSVILHESGRYPCCHTFRATGITAYLSNGGTLEHAQQIAGHASPKTTKLYDRTADTITVDEIERIVI